MSIILLTILLTIIIFLSSVLSIINEDSEETKIINEIRVKYPTDARYFA